MHNHSEILKIITKLDKAYEILEALTPIIKKTKKTRKVEKSKRKMFEVYQKIVLKLLDLQKKGFYMLVSGMEGEIAQKYLKKDITQCQKYIREISKNLKKLDPHLARTFYLMTISKM